MPLESRSDVVSKQSVRIRILLASRLSAVIKKIRQIGIVELSLSGCARSRYRGLAAMYRKYSYDYVDAEAHAQSKHLGFKQERFELP